MRVSRRVFLGVAATAGLGGGAARAQDNIVTLAREHPDGRQRDVGTQRFEPEAGDVQRERRRRGVAAPAPA